VNYEVTKRTTKSSKPDGEGIVLVTFVPPWVTIAFLHLPVGLGFL
jgi:hypothetical protein